MKISDSKALEQAIQQGDLFDGVRSAGPGVLISHLAERSALPEAEVLNRLAPMLGLKAMNLEMLRLLEPDFSLVGFADCLARQCLIGWRTDHSEIKTCVAVISDPLNLSLQQWIDRHLEQVRRDGWATETTLALSADLQAALSHAEKNLLAMDQSEAANDLPDVKLDSSDTSVISLSIASIETTESPLVRLVDSILYDALKTGVSDIHFETQSTGLHVKYRIDGVLENVKQVDNAELGHQAISRLKVLSELDISERRIPQDGRFKVRVDRRDIDFRVSIMPNLFGEDAVLRVLDRKHLTGQFEKLTLDSLSFEQPVKDFIRQASTLPYGLLLVTGPTGSGKTTTLYAALSEINKGLDKIITIEDPIEYQLKGILQIPVNEKKGLTFARGLRSVLRHDPDKIMVGEIRDAETAHIAVQAALTGHQVFTTVHANNVFDVIGRFKNMEVDSYSLVSALTGIVAQRLLRAVCTHCAVPDQSSRETLQQLGFPNSVRGSGTLVRAVGCPFCRGTGYKGRLAIAETLEMEDEIRDLLVQQASISQLKQVARQKGFTSLRDSAVALAQQGRTTVEEVNRVTPREVLTAEDRIGSVATRVQAEPLLSHPS